MTTRTIASVGSTRLGSGRSPASIRRASWKRAARMTPSVPAIERSKGGPCRGVLTGHLCLVDYHQRGSKRLHHPIVGDLELSYEVMELSADSGLTRRQGR